MRTIGVLGLLWLCAFVASVDGQRGGGRRPPPEKVALCHRTGNGEFHLIVVAPAAEKAHRAHGDAAPGEVIPGRPPHVFGPTCELPPGCTGCHRP